MNSLQKCSPRSRLGNSLLRTRYDKYHAKSQDEARSGIDQEHDYGAPPLQKKTAEDGADCGRELIRVASPCRRVGKCPGGHQAGDNGRGCWPSQRAERPRSEEKKINK